jgi:hypothetical protein
MLLADAAHAQEKPVAGLIPKAQTPVKLDGNLEEWEGAFVTPVHVGHPDFANRGGQFLFLWDDDNLYVGLRCLDRKPAHVAPDDRLYDGDAVEFYLDTRGDRLGAKDFGPGTLHVFWTPFTGTEVKPRLRVRDRPAFRGFTLKGAEVAAVKTAWGYTAESKLPWANFPGFKPRAGDVLGIDCELCSSDGGPRVDRTFVFSSPASVSSPAAFGRVRLVDKIDPAGLKPYSRALLPLSLTKSANYPWLYGTACLSPTIEKAADRLEGRILDRAGKVRKTTGGTRRTLAGSGFVMWTGQWELFDLPPGGYTVELRALSKGGAVIAARSVQVIHGDAAGPAKDQNPSPMTDHTRPHPRLEKDKPAGRRLSLDLGTLFLPEGLSLKGDVPLFVHFHGGTWLPEVAAARHGRAAVLAVQLGAGSGVYGKAFADPGRFGRLLREAEDRAGVRFGPVGLTAWSAGYGAVRAILRDPASYARVRFVLLLDGLHAGYADGEPRTGEPRLVPGDLEVFMRFARDAAAGRKQMIVTHIEVFPGTFASTTETADYLLRELGLRRRPVLRWGPLRTQQLSEAGKGSFRVAGYAGNSAPDHVDQLHALPEYLGWIDWGQAAPAKSGGASRTPPSRPRRPRRGPGRRVRGRECR